MIIKDFLEGVAISLLAVFAPIKAMMISTLTLTMIDLVTGVLAARKRKEPITSSGIGRTVVKVLVFQIAIISGFIVQKYMIQDAIQVASLVAGLIGITEMKSVLENLDGIQGGSLFKVIVDKLGSQNDKPQDPPK